MGNICSSGQKKKKKDSTSDKSEDSYRIASTAEENVKLQKSELCQTRAEDSKEENNPTAMLENQIPNAKTSDSCNMSEQPCTQKILSDTSKEILNTDLCKLLGKIKWNGNADSKMNKIVIYILMENSVEFLKHRHMLYNLKPQLEKKCKMHNFEFIIVDVHKSWQYSTKMEVDISKNIFDNNYWNNEANCYADIKAYYEDNIISMSEMKRHLETSYVIPILFFGTSMGLPILPLTIESGDFLTSLNSVNKEERILLEKWYFKYNNVEYHLNTNHIENSINIEQNKELNKLLQILLNCVVKKLLKSTYISTIIEYEINQMIISYPDVGKRCIWIQNEPQNMKMNENASPVELEMMQRITRYHIELKSCTLEKNLIKIPPNITVLENELISILGRLLENSIQCIIEEHSANSNLTHNTNGIDHILIKELETINHYTKQILKRTYNDTNDKDTVISEIKRYIENSTDYPLIISGPIGCGKTTLCSKIYSSAHEWKSDVNIILRYAKLTAESSDLVTILGSIINQMSVLVNGSQIKAEHTLERYAKIFCDLINNDECFFVIIIDSIDELLYFDENNDDIVLNWLPKHMGNMCKIILTITEDNPNYSVLIEKLKERYIVEEAFAKINVFSQNQWNQALQTNNIEFNVLNMLKKIPQEWYQLHGETIFHVKSLRWLEYLGNPILRIDNISKVLEIILNIMETKLSPGYMDIMLLIICLPEWGISESDCIGIFKMITKLDEQTVLNLWSKFCWLMHPILLYIGNLCTVDDIFKNFILQRRYKQKHLSIHISLRDYYKQQEGEFMTTDNPPIKIYNYTKYLMEPYHHLQVLIKESPSDNIYDQLNNCAYFTDIKWIVNKINAVGPSCLIHDILVCERINRELASINYVHVNLLKKFLIKYIHELNYDGNQFFTLFKYYTKTIMNDVINLELRNDDKIRTWLHIIENIKTPFLEILNNSLNNVDEEAIHGTSSSSQRIYDALINLPNDGYFIASLSALKEEVCIWDVQKCVRVRVLEGIPQPTAMCPFGSHKAAVLCRREIKIIDMDEGKFEVTLKGVMNQKMPYFGLHDQKHLVCLSRNRMYVNLMDLESGDCVTTFKAGEDRFLNSLLVSGDGRILVCGDETQKPFPLLVWHLSQRKLLYDLRIPCHDFITALSAITYEGSYVCVVAKELNEPAPNFIVVYDLQSGTLFKKWKPNCNTVALAISQLNACVIAGLYDAKILIWDLVTGNCRATLIGHNAPVTCLKLDPLGKVLLSTNKEGYDNSLRLWELHSGKSLAVFKPPGRVSACEVLANGTHVAIGLFDWNDLLILSLRNYNNNTTKSIVHSYGKEDNQYKVFKLEIT